MPLTDEQRLELGGDDNLSLYHAARYGSGNTPIGGLTKDLWDLGVQVGQGEVDDVLLKELNNVGGTLFHYPSSQTNRAIDAYWREHVEGDDVPIYEYLTGRRNR